MAPPPADSYLLAQEHTQLLFWDSPHHLSTELHCHKGEFICLLEHKETHGLERKAAISLPGLNAGSLTLLAQAVP